MSVKNVLLAGCALFAVAGFLRSESDAAGQGAVVGQAPAADLFTPGRSDAGPAPLAPAQRAADGSPRPASTPAGPWQFAKPRSSAAAAVDGPADGIDLSALRYYAAQNELARVSAEIKQIRSRHPDWQPPDDLFSDAGGGADEQPLWDLFAKGDLAGVRDGIAAIQRDKPDWQPSADLRSKFAEAEARRDWIAASDAKRWDDVVAVAAKNVALLTCANTDLLWRTAEALASTGDEAKASDAYAYVLKTCREPQERLATVQKAALVLKAPGALDALMGLGRVGADGRSEFEPVRVAMLRQKMGAALQAGATPAPADVEALKADWAKTRDGDDADMLAWTALAGKQAPDAEAWFRNAIGVADTPKRSEGLALALRNEHRLPEAVKVLLPRSEADAASAKLLVELVSASLTDPKEAKVAPEASVAFLKAIEAAKSADGAQAYGWNLYRAGQTAAAADWFAKSNAWQANEAAVIGLVVSAKRMKREAVFHDLVSRYAALYPKVGQLAAVMRSRGPERRAITRVASVPSPAASARAVPKRIARASAPGRAAAPGSAGGRWDRSADAIVAAYEGGDYDRTMSLLDDRRRTSTEPSGLSVIRGWAQYHRGDWEGAKQTFVGLHDSEFDASREGLRVIQNGYTNPHFR